MFNNIKKLLVGGAIAKLIGISLMPIITRLYSPEDMGITAQLLSFILIVAPILNLRYCLAIPLPKRERTAITLAKCSFLFSLSLSLLILFIIVFFRDTIVYVFDLGKVSEYLYLVVFASFFLSIQEVFVYWATRKKNFGLISKVLLKQSLIGGTGKVVFGLLFPSALSLITGTLLQYLTGVVAYLLFFIKGEGFIKGRWSRTLFILKYYFNYVYLKLPAHFMFVLASQAPILLCSNIFELKEVGQLSLAISLITIPIGIISQSVSKVYYAEVSSLGRGRTKEIYKLTVLTLGKLVMLGGAIFLVVYLLAPIVFMYVFGSKWELAGELASALSFILILQIAATTLITSLNVLNLNFLSFGMHATRLILIFLTFYIAESRGFNILNTIYSYSFILTFHYFLIIIVIILIMKKGSESEG